MAWVTASGLFRPPRYGSVAGAGPTNALLLGVAFAFASVRYLTSDAVGMIGTVMFFVLLGLDGVYMIGHAALGVPDWLRPRPQRGLTRRRWRTPEEDDDKVDSSWADSAVRRKPRRRR